MAQMAAAWGMARCRLSLSLFFICMLTTSTDFALSNSQPNGRKQVIKFPVGQKVPDNPGEAMSVGMGGSMGGGVPRTKSKEYMDTALIINKGVEAYQSKLYPQAAEFFGQAISGSQDTALLAAAFVNLGMCYSATKDFKKAIEFFKKSLDLQPDDSQTQLDLANALLLAGEYAQAKQLGLALLSRLKITDIAAVSLYTLMGNIALSTAKWADAVEAFAKTLEVNKHYSPAYIGMGEAYNQLELFEESVAALKKAIAIDPGHGHALFSLGKVLLKAAGKVGNNETQNLLDSIYYSQKHMALGGPTTHALFNKAAALHRLGNCAAALPSYREAQWRLQAINQKRGVSVLEDEMIQLIYHEGECLYRLRKYEAAADRYLRATEERPYFAGAFLALANCYEASGDHDAAIQAGWASVHALQAEVASPGIAGGTPKFLRGDTQPWSVYHKLVESMIRGGRPLPQIWDTMHQWRKANKKWGMRPWMTTVPAKKLLNSHIAARVPPQRYLPRPRGAVVYLCCKGAEDLENMIMSVRLLYRHFLRTYPYQVFVFYGPEFLQEGHRKLIRDAGRPSEAESGVPAAIRFVPVNISSVLPHTEKRCNWSYRGYCEMSRFFAGALHDMPVLAEYEFVWRMDTDSFLLAPLQVDLFQGAANFGCAYTVATMSVEPSDVVSGLWETVEAFMQRNSTAQSSSDSWWKWTSKLVGLGEDETAGAKDSHAIGAPLSANAAPKKARPTKVAGTEAELGVAKAELARAKKTNNALKIAEAELAVAKVELARASNSDDRAKVAEAQRGVERARLGVEKARLGVEKARVGVEKARLGVVMAKIGVSEAELRVAEEELERARKTNDGVKIAEAELAVTKAESGVAKARLGVEKVVQGVEKAMQGVKKVEQGVEKFDQWVAKASLGRPAEEGPKKGGEKKKKKKKKKAKDKDKGKEKDGHTPIDDTYALHPLSNKKRILSTIMMMQGPTGRAVWNRLHFYNNFEISRLSFWRSPQYREYFEYIDKAGGIFEHRWGDSPIKSLAALLFLRDEQFCYVGDELTYMHQSWLPLTIPSAKTPEEGGPGSWAQGLQVGVRRNQSRDNEDEDGGAHGLGGFLQYGGGVDLHVAVEGFDVEDSGGLGYSPSSLVCTPSFQAGGSHGEGRDGLGVDVDVKCETCGRDTG